MEQGDGSVRITIVKEDNVVLVESMALNIDCSSLPDDFHALQWYGTWGEVEFITDFSSFPATRKPNLTIRDLSPYKSIIDAWEAKARQP